MYYAYSNISEFLFLATSGFRLEGERLENMLKVAADLFTGG